MSANHQNLGKYKFAKSLRGRLVIILTLITAVVILIASTIAVLILRENAYGQTDQELRKIISAPDIEQNYFPQDGQDTGNNLNSSNTIRNPHFVPWARPGCIHYVLTDGALSATYFTDDFSSVTLTEAQIATFSEIQNGELETVEVPDLGSYRFLKNETTASDNSTVVKIVGLPLSTPKNAVRNAVLIQIGTAALAISSIVIFAGWIIRKELQPLSDVAQTARRVSNIDLSTGDGTLNFRSPIDNPETEVGLVGHSLNLMLGNIEKSFQERAQVEEKLRQFVADASHELRTPLASISGYTELLQNYLLKTDGPALSETSNVTRALNRIEHESGRMKSLVEDLLLLARLDQHNELHKEPCELTEIATNAVFDAKVSAPDYHWELVFLNPEPGTQAPQNKLLDSILDASNKSAMYTSSPSGLDAPKSLEILGDPNRLTQVFSNLLANTGRHTPAGTKSITAITKEESEIKIFISDNGPGIPIELQKTVMDRFVRADSARTRKDGSTGLGLSIVKALVEGHNGKISLMDPGEAQQLFNKVDSHFKPGTTWEISLPVFNNPS
ncbi:MAG: HAMP domain-containing sensor histidine kinase [Arcanobacterium sp.]|nr:HAMP domain-containing sensor histidine kinase [Arcanobacterium sp.]